MLRILLVVAVVIQFTAAQITVTPTFDKVLNIDESFTYKCQNGDSSSTEYPVWTDMNNAVVPSSSSGSNNRVSTTESIEGGFHVTRLQFTGVEITENGNYTCTVGGAYIRKEVIVAIPPTFPRMEMEESQRLLVDTTAYLTCTINSNPFPTIQWYFNNQYISGSEANGRYSMRTTPIIEPDMPGLEHAEEAILEVRDVISTDSGSYRCLASVDQTGGTGEMTIEVLAQVRPEWTVEPMNVAEVEGQSITIQCAASGTPEPTYTWADSSDVPILPLTDKYEFSDNGEYFSVLNLESADDQLYTCIASNDAINSTIVTDIRKTIRLEVLIPPALNAQDNQTVEEGSDYTLQCYITRADAQGTLSWRRGGDEDEDALPLGVWNLDSRVTVASSDDGRTLTLTLSPSHYDHSGGWICYATSDAGDAQVTHFVFVESQPFIDRSETPSRVVSWPGNPVNMTCVFKGYPAPSIKWYINNYVLNETERITFLPNTPKGTSIVQMNPTQSDFGPYLCEGKNSVGTSSERIDLVEGNVPSAPENLRIVDITSSTMRLTYDAPEDDGGFDILRYEVLYNEGEGTISTSREYDNITDVLVTGLAGDTRYYVKVGAINDRGVGLYSTEVSDTTLVVSAPGKCKITSGTESEYSDKYRLTWEAPEDDGGSDIEKFLLEFSQVDGPLEKELPRSIDYEIDNTLREFMIAGLNENKYYYLELRAENTIGTGLPADRNFKTTGGFSFATTPKTRPKQELGVLGTTEIVAIVVACFVILLILIDVCCFCMNDCGVLMFFCVNCCGKTAPSSKDEIEMGDEEYGKDYHDEDNESDFDYRYTEKPTSDPNYRYGFPGTTDC